MDCPGMSVKVVMRRLERERDIARSDVERLQEERDALRERLRLVSGTQVAEHARMEKTYLECETRVHKLEAERRELMTCQGSRRATITHLEEQCDTLRDQLR
uniref:Uncharacterized protein n=1 Tax=Timema poppense TaxID=170557 RepID=A0A7R9CVP6_TIMPO|nr:unnamed protein product [Timema poppensis]